MQEVASNLTEYQKGNYILTDDQAPVELLGMQVIDELIKDEVQYYKRYLIKNGGIKRVDGVSLIFGRNMEKRKS